MSHFKVIGIARLTREPELRSLPNGTAVVDLSVVTNDKYKDKETSSFMAVVAFGGLADVIAKYFKKGDPIMIDGTLQQDTWEKEGERKSRHKIVLRGFDFVGGKKGKCTDPTPTQTTYRFKETTQ